MIRLTLLIILLSASAHGQTVIHHSSRTDERSPIAAIFTLHDRHASTLDQPPIRSFVSDVDASAFLPVLLLTDSADCSIRIDLADRSHPPVPHECTVNELPALWFTSSDSIRQLLYLADSQTLEWEIILDSRVATNYFRFPVQLSGLNAYYQPPLTKEEILAGHERPDSIVGSYALYRKTGEKLLHIPRPRAFDADGLSAWVDLTIDSCFSVTLPEEFLANARYPVRIDPSFGYSNAGASSLAAASVRCYANRNANYRYTAGFNQRVDSFRVHLRTLSGNNDTVDVALYSWDNGIQNRLDTAVWIFTASATASWVSSGPVAQSMVDGVTYTMALNHHEGTPRISYDVGYSGDYSYDTADDLPAVWTEDGVGTYLISMQTWYSTVTTTTTPPTRRRRLE